MRCQRVILALVLIATVSSGVLMSAGCSRAENELPKPLTWPPDRDFSNDTKSPPDPIVPPPPMLGRGPQQAVYSYLLWISHAYRILDSNVATPTFTPWEEVRVNSYVQLNRQRGRAIDQVITALDFKREPRVTEDTSTLSGAGIEESDARYTLVATVPATEKWKYRYIDISQNKYNSPWYDVTYDSTYTVVFDDSRKAWLVHKVEATPRGEVK